MVQILQFGTASTICLHKFLFRWYYTYGGMILKYLSFERGFAMHYYWHFATSRPSSMPIPLLSHVTEMIQEILAPAFTQCSKASYPMRLVERFYSPLIVSIGYSHNS